MGLNDIQTLRFFETRDHPCSYLENQEAKTIFVDPNAELDGNVYSQLSDLGFRRSGRHVYRPNCENCRACIPIRIPVKKFLPSRSQLRCFKRNKDIQTSRVSTIDTKEHYELYENYINLRHSDGDMFPADRDQYRDFLTSEWGITQYLEFRNPEKKLLAVGVLDQLEAGYSAVYFYFDPNEDKRSLGMFNILHLIERAKENNLPFVYLGYWIKECQKMSYKTRYQPFEVFIANTWVTVSEFTP